MKIYGKSRMGGRVWMWWVLLCAGCAVGSERVERWPVDASEGMIRQFYEENREKVFTRGETVWVKSIVKPDEEGARQACRRARAGEDFDELIAEYFVPYFAGNRKEKYVEKRVEDFVRDREGFWRGQSEAGPLVGMKAGDIAGPVLRFGKGPHWAVLKVEAVSEGYVAKLDDVRDSIYQLLWFRAADRKMLKEVDLGGNPWCGTCRAGHDVNGQLWRLAQRYDKEGEVGKAVSACLLALNENRGMGGAKATKINEEGLYPEEQYLADRGMDVVRYYAGCLRKLPGSSAPERAYWRLGGIKDDRAIPLLLKFAKRRGPEGSRAAYVLAGRKVRGVVPALREMLKDRRVHIVEHHRGGVVSVYAEYYVRERAKKALELMGEDAGDVKVVIGAVVTDGEK